MPVLRLEQPLTVDIVAAAVRNHHTAVISPTIRDTVPRLHKAMLKKSASEKVYGINTGFGPMVTENIPPANQQQLQYNLIRSHACGVGSPLPPDLVRAIILTRLNTLHQNYSAVSLEALTALQVFFNSGFIPYIPKHGSVGASGDLIQLAHIALCLIGEGHLVDDLGTLKKTSQILKKHTILPLALTGRDGLALINGTGAMTGIAAIVLADSKKLIENCITLSAMLYTIFSVNTEHIDPLVALVRPHHGQKHVAEKLRSLIKYSSVNTTSLQAVYSLRCVPQILGPIFETLENAIKITNIELNSVTDNPLFGLENNVVHNGNFHGDYIAHEMDKVRIGLTKASILMERQLNFLVNPKLNGILPPYVNRNTPGIDLALQAVQFVATSTTAENQTLSHPLVTHSIPTNNDNQDVVSMGCNSALLTNQVLQNCFTVQATLALTVLEAIDVANVTLPPTLRAFYKKLRACSKPLTSDRPLYEDLSRIAATLTH